MVLVLPLMMVDQWTKKLRILATEKRRHSILRASGHTFEYLGYVSGNYSTGLPQKQDRILTREEQFLSQSQTPNGGAVVYTGMNDAGDFYIGNKVINAQDGTEVHIQYSYSNCNWCF